MEFPELKEALKKAIHVYNTRMNGQKALRNLLEGPGQELEICFYQGSGDSELFASDSMQDSGSSTTIYLLDFPALKVIDIIISVRGNFRCLYPDMEYSGVTIAYDPALDKIYCPRFDGGIPNFYCASTFNELKTQYTSEFWMYGNFADYNEHIWNIIVLQQMFPDDFSKIPKNFLQQKLFSQYDASVSSAFINTFLNPIIDTTWYFLNNEEPPEALKEAWDYWIRALLHGTSEEEIKNAFSAHELFSMKSKYHQEITNLT